MQGIGAGEIRQPAPQSKLRELRPRARATCFVPVMAINKADFLAGISYFHVLARFRADFLATIETLPVFYIDVHPAQTGILRISRKSMCLSIDLCKSEQKVFNI